MKGVSKDLSLKKECRVDIKGRHITGSLLGSALEWAQGKRYYRS